MVCNIAILQNTSLRYGWRHHQWCSLVHWGFRVFSTSYPPPLKCVRRSFIKNDNPSSYLPWVALLFCKIKLIFFLLSKTPCVFIHSSIQTLHFHYSTIRLTQQSNLAKIDHVSARIHSCSSALHVPLSTNKWYQD